MAELISRKARKDKKAQRRKLSGFVAPLRSLREKTLY